MQIQVGSIAECLGPPTVGGCGGVWCFFSRLISDLSLCSQMRHCIDFLQFWEKADVYIGSFPPLHNCEIKCYPENKQVSEDLCNRTAFSVQNRLDQQPVPGKARTHRAEPRPQTCRAGGEEAPGRGLREREAPLGVPRMPDWMAGRARHGGLRGPGAAARTLSSQSQAAKGLAQQLAQRPRTRVQASLQRSGAW